MTITDPNALVGIPYRRDFNCAHFVEHVELAMFGRHVRLPGGGVRSPVDRASDYDLAPTDAPKDGDLVLMFDLGRPVADHVGVFFRLKHEEWVLHLLARGAGVSVLTRVRELGGLGLRIEGVYSWAN